MSNTKFPTGTCHYKKKVEFPLMKRIRKFGVLQTSDERMLELALCFLLGFPIDNVTSLLDYKSSYDHWPPSCSTTIMISLAD